MTKLRISRRWAESILAWSDRHDGRGFIGAIVGEDGTGEWYACDLQNVLYLDGREKALRVSRPRAGKPGAYLIERKALAVALATTDALARIEMHDADDVRVEVARPGSPDEEPLARVREMMAGALRAEPCQHGRGFPFSTFGRLAAHLEGCASATGIDAQPVRVGAMEAWRFTDRGRTSAMVMGSSMLHKIAQRGERPKVHPTAVVEVMADTVQIMIPDGTAKMIDAYHIGELRAGEEVVVDRDGVAWIVGVEGGER